MFLQLVIEITILTFVYVVTDLMRANNEVPLLSTKRSIMSADMIDLFVDNRGTSLLALIKSVTT